MLTPTVPTPSALLSHHAPPDTAKPGALSHAQLWRPFTRPATPLYEFDVKTCLPTLLLTLFSDPDESRRYRELLEGDTYNTIRDETGMRLGRDEVKRQFAMVINTKNRSEPWLFRHPIMQFFQERFPLFVAGVLARRRDMAKHFQGLEASIMVHKVGRWCREKGAFWIPEHDGFLSTLSEGKEIEIVAAQFLEEGVRGSVQFKQDPVSCIE